MALLLFSPTEENRNKRILTENKCIITFIVR